MFLNLKINNSIRTGTIAEVNLEIFVVKVTFEGFEGSADLPYYVGTAGNAKLSFAPEVGDKVLVLAPNGNPSEAIAVPLAPSKKVENDTWEIEFKQAKISYKAGELNIESSKDITVKSEKIILNSSSVEIAGTTGGGVVCQNHTCAFSGGPHPQGSSKIKGAL